MNVSHPRLYPRGRRRFKCPVGSEKGRPFPRLGQPPDQPAVRTGHAEAVAGHLAGRGRLDLVFGRPRPARVEEVVPEVAAQVLPGRAGDAPVTLAEPADGLAVADPV